MAEAPFVVPFKKPRLFGRDHLLKPLHEKLKDRTVALTPALTGQGGIGKTQLAALYVHTYRSAYDGGIFWLNLADPAPAHILRQIGGSFAPALGLTSTLNEPESKDRDLTEQWLGRVRNQRNILVVADNLEHPALLSQLDAVPNSSLTALDCPLLVTSRTRGLPGCDDVALERLPLKAARALMLDETGQDALGLDQAERDAIDRVCNMVGGLPLALRLASALVREEAARFADLASALGEHNVIELLDGQDYPEDYVRDNVGRALTELIESSLKTIPERRSDWLDLLKTAAVFPQSAILRADFLRCFVKHAQGRLPGGDPFRRALTELYNRHLMELPDEARATVRLHPLIHTYMGRQLDHAFLRACVERATDQLLAADHLRSMSNLDLIEMCQDLALLPDATDLVEETSGILLTAFRKTIERQAHDLRAGTQPLVQLHYQAERDAEEGLAECLDNAVGTLAPRLRPMWSTGATDPAQIRVFTGHERAVLSCAFGPDGRHALSGSGDKTLILWDVASGAVVRRFEGHEGAVYACAISPDGRQVVSGSSDHTLILWGVETGMVVGRFEGHERVIWACAFSSDGRHALSGSDDETLILWDVETGTLVRRLEGHEGAVYTCAIGPDGRQAVSGSSDHTLILWDVESGTVMRRFKGHKRAVYACAFSPDGRYVLSGSSDHRLILWATTPINPLETLEGHLSGLWDPTVDPAQIRVFTGHERAVFSCAFSPDGRQVLSGSHDRTLILWDVESGTVVSRFEGHHGLVRACTFSPDGRQALSGSHDRTLVLWSLASGRAKRRVAGHEAGVQCCAFSPDGRHALSASDDRTLILWEVVTGAAVRRFKGHGGGPVWSCAFSPDGQYVLSGSTDQTLILWDVESGTAEGLFEGHNGWVKSCAFSPDGRHALSASDDRTLILWDVASGRAERRFEGHELAVNSCVFSPCGRRALSGSSDRTLTFWDVSSGAVVRRFEGHELAVRSCAFSPDGRRALSGSDDRTLILWDVESGAVVQRFEGHEARVNSCAFSPDGRRALSGSDDRTLVLWDVESGEKVATIALHGLSCGALSPDGCRVLVGDGKGDVSLFEITAAHEEAAHE